MNFEDYAFTNSFAFVLNQLQIKRLDLSNNNIRSLKQLFCQTALFSARLEVLVLSNNPIDFSEYVEKMQFPELKQLHLEGTPCARTEKYLQFTGKMIINGLKFTPCQSQFEPMNHPKNAGNIAEAFGNADITEWYQPKTQTGMTAQPTQIQIIFPNQTKVKVSPNQLIEKVQEYYSSKRLLMKTERINTTDSIVGVDEHPGLRV